MARQHIFTDTQRPTSAPMFLGDHFVNLGNEETYFSTLTGDISGWVGDLSGATRDVDGNFVVKTRDCNVAFVMRSLYFVITMVVGVKNQAYCATDAAEFKS